MNPINKTSWFMGSTGTQNDKVNIVVDTYMDLLKNMPMFKSYGDNIKTTVKAELAARYIPFRSKSSYYENTVKKMGFTDDPNKSRYQQAEDLTFDNIVKFYNEKIKNAPVIIVIHGNPKYIDLKSIESKYGKVNRVPMTKIFKGGEL